MSNKSLSKAIYSQHGSHTRTPNYSRTTEPTAQQEARRLPRPPRPPRPPLQQQRPGAHEGSVYETLSTPFSLSESLRPALANSLNQRRWVDSSSVHSSTMVVRRANESPDSPQFLHMPKHLRESMSPEQHEVYLGLQQEPSAFASRQFVIPREKMNDPEVRESLRAYVQSIIEEAAECAEVLKSCARTESLSLPPRTLHKWETKATKSGAGPTPVLQLPIVKLERMRSNEEMDTEMTLGSHVPRRAQPSRMRLISKLLPNLSRRSSRGGSVSQSVYDKDEDRSHTSARSRHSSWKTLSFFSQIVEKPRLESLRDWSFSRIVVIDILRTRKQDLVASARHTFSGEWAILKIVWKRRFRSKRRDVARERKAWEAVSDCQFIVGLKSFFSTSLCYCFVAEYYEGCTLQALLEEGALRDDVIVNIVAQITYALKYIHDRDMMYRNISPTTILIDMNGIARLFDFAFCSEGKTSSSRIGSIPYMAPEVLRMEVYDRASDYWSLGILVYVLYVRHTPMSIYSAKTNLDHWVDRDYMYQYAEVVPIVLPKHMPQHAKSLISGLLVERPRLRLGCRSTGFFEIMKHPFFHRIDWDGFSKIKGVTPRNVPRGYQSP